MIDAKIRRAVPDDASALAELRFAFKQEDNESTPPPMPTATFTDVAEPWLRERLENGTWLAWLAEVDTQICGHVFLHLIEKLPDPYPGPALLGYVTNFYVTPPHRAQGLGRQLLDALHTYASANQLDTLIVWPSERSAPLYNRAGFTQPHELLELPVHNHPTDNTTP
jgi:GNAT superfamily N-acetyltransferase